MANGIPRRSLMAGINASSSRVIAGCKSYCNKGSSSVFYNFERRPDPTSQREDRRVSDKKQRIASLHGWWGVALPQRECV